MGFLTSTAVLLLLALEISATVHRFPAKHRSRSKEHVEMIKAMRDGPKPSLESHNVLRAHRANLDRNANPAFLENQEAEPSSGRFPINYGYYFFSADISIGSPPQRLTVDIDPFYDGHLGVIGSDANLRLVSTVPKKVYNSSASSTYTPAPGNFTDYGGRGHWGNDVVNFGGINVNLTFGIDDMLNSWYDEEPIDGILGLSPRGDHSDPQNSVLQQLLNSTSKVDQPLLTIWTNLTRNWNDSAQITVGSDDPEHCQSDSWAFGTEVNSDYIVNVTSATAIVNGSDLAVDLGTKPLNLMYGYYLHVPKTLWKVIIAASNATYNDHVYHYALESCDISKIPPVRLDMVGGTKPLTLIAADYVTYSSYYDTCFLNMYYFDDHSDDNVMYVPHQFQRNHCIAYNFQKKTVGVGMSKWALQSPKDF